MEAATRTAYRPGEIGMLAAVGSWKAREWLGRHIASYHPRTEDIVGLLFWQHHCVPFATEEQDKIGRSRSIKMHQVFQNVQKDFHWNACSIKGAFETLTACFENDDVPKQR